MAELIDQLLNETDSSQEAGGGEDTAMVDELLTQFSATNAPIAQRIRAGAESEEPQATEDSGIDVADIAGRTVASAVGARVGAGAGALAGPVGAVAGGYAGDVAGSQLYAAIQGALSGKGALNQMRENAISDITSPLVGAGLTKAGKVAANTPIGKDAILGLSTVFEDIVKYIPVIKNLARQTEQSRPLKQQN